MLHKLQQTAPVKPGDKVSVFLYKDPHGRLTASMRTPRMREGQIARLKVINTSRDGAFLDVGAERGIFMPYAGMRGKLQVGEVVWAKLYTDKSGRLAMTMKVEDEIRRASRPADNVKVGDMVSGSVYNFTEQGAFIFTDERFIAFLDKREMTTKPRVGQTLTHVLLLFVMMVVSMFLCDQSKKKLLILMLKCFMIHLWLEVAKCLIVMKPLLKLFVNALVSVNLPLNVH